MSRRSQKAVSHPTRDISPVKILPAHKDFGLEDSECFDTHVASDLIFENEKLILFANTGLFIWDLTDPDSKCTFQRSCSESTRMRFYRRLKSGIVLTGFTLFETCQTQFQQDTDLHDSCMTPTMFEEDGEVFFSQECREIWTDAIHFFQDEKCIKCVDSHHEMQFDTMCFLEIPDSNFFVFTSQDKSIDLWDSVKMERVKTVTNMTQNGHQHAIMTMKLLSNGEIVSADVKGVLKTWKIPQLEMNKSTSRKIGPGSIYGLDTQDSLIAVCGNAGIIHVYDLDLNLTSRSDNKLGNLSHCMFLNNGFLVTFPTPKARKQRIHILNLMTMQVIDEMDGEYPLCDVISKQSQLFIVTRNQCISIYDFSRYQDVEHFPQGWMFGNVAFEHV